MGNPCYRASCHRVQQPATSQLGHQRRFNRKSRTSAYAPAREISLRRSARPLAYPRRLNECTDLTNACKKLIDDWMNEAGRLERSV